MGNLVQSKMLNLYPRLSGAYIFEYTRQVAKNNLVLGDREWLIILRNIPHCMLKPRQTLANWNSLSPYLLAKTRTKTKSIYFLSFNPNCSLNTLHLGAWIYPEVFSLVPLVYILFLCQYHTVFITVVL